MNTKVDNTICGLRLTIETLKKQFQNGLGIVNGNEGCGTGNLWSYLYMMKEDNNHELAEQVRRSFLRKSPQEALALIEKIRHEVIKKALGYGLL